MIKLLIIFLFLTLDAFSLSTGIFPDWNDLNMRKKDYWDSMALMGMLSAYIFWSGFNK